MASQLPPIYFYISQYDWISEHMPDINTLYDFSTSGHGICDGELAWTLQTYLRLKTDDFPCELTGTMPEEGIVLAHYKALSFYFKPGPRVLLICLKADKNPRPYAHIQVVQNRDEVKTIRHSYYIPHWPHPGLCPRDPARGDLFEVAAFFGVRLAPEFTEAHWHQQLQHLGLHWQVKSREQWHDYSNTDVVVAVRCFEPKGPAARQLAAILTRKPASKLYNAWHAGVPAILGREPAFQAECKSELDYIEVRSLTETVSALTYLRDHPKLRQAMIQNGWRRAEETSTSRLVEQWRHFLTEIAVPYHDRWCRLSNVEKQAFLMHRSLKIKWSNIQHRLQILAGQPIEY